MSQVLRGPLTVLGRLLSGRVRYENRLRNHELLRSGVMRWRALRRARHARTAAR